MFTITLNHSQREVNLQALTLYIETLQSQQRESLFSPINRDRIETAQTILTLLNESIP